MPRAKHAGGSRDPRDAYIKESSVQTGCMNVLRMLGYATWRVGQRDARGTQDPGFPDLTALKRGEPVTFVECKRLLGGKQSDAQKRFEQQALAAGARYILANSSVVLLEELTKVRGT